MAVSCKSDEYSINNSCVKRNDTVGVNPPGSKDECPNGYSKKYLDNGQAVCVKIGATMATNTSSNSNPAQKYLSSMLTVVNSILNKQRQVTAIEDPGGQGGGVCPRGQKWDNAKQRCVPSTAIGAGTVAIEDPGGQGGGVCPRGQKWDNAKQRCVPSTAIGVGTDNITIALNNVVTVIESELAKINSMTEAQRRNLDKFNRTVRPTTPTMAPMPPVSGTDPNTPPPPPPPFNGPVSGTDPGYSYQR